MYDYYLIKLYKRLVSNQCYLINVHNIIITFIKSKSMKKYEKV